MTSTESEHDWFREQIAAYLTNGLSADEQSRFESHAQSCSDCVGELEQLRQMEASMSSAFAGATPTTDFEDRLLGRLRLSVRFRQWIHPLVRRVAVAAALGIVVAGFGYVGKELMDRGRLPTAQTIAGNLEDASKSVHEVVGDFTNPTTQESVDEQRRLQQRQYVQYAVDNALGEFESKVKVQDLAGAQRNIDAARAGRNANPKLFDDNELRGFDQRIADAQVRLDQTRASKQLQDGKQTIARERETQTVTEQQTRDTVAQLTREARGLTRRGEYQRAIGVLDQVLKLDPNNDYALGARELVQDRIAVLDQREWGKMYDRNVVKQYNDAEEEKIPYSDILRFPSNWPDVNASAGTVSFYSTAQATPSFYGGDRFVLPTDGKDEALNPTRGYSFHDAYGDYETPNGGTLTTNLITTGGTSGLAANISGAQSSPRFKPTDFGLAVRGSKMTGEKLNESGANTHAGATVVDGRGLSGDDFTNGSLVKQLEVKQEIGANFGVPPALALADTDADPTSAQTNGPQPGRAAANGDARPATQPAAQGQAPAPAQVHRVIRDGVMEFEVDSFDSAFVTISRITTEEGGFIAAADSDKLPNGKVRGTITLRVPPDRLDTLVLKLRALGELKSQKLGSKDVSREYTDLESELRAARAMEERLLEMIKTAKGKVAELLEAERELGNWRTRIEKMTGQLNYYNNLVSMATLSITAYEKDIRTPASASQTEEINTGVETDDVEHARAEVIKSIDEAKGRIIESELKQLEAGQLAAKVVAEVAPENAGPILDRLKQLGRIARLDIQRKQTTDAQPQGARPAGPIGAPKLETAPTRLIVSMYNLANVAPRLTTNLNLAGDDVEAVYRSIIKRVGDANGRVISSNLVRQDATQATGAIQFEVKSSEADAVLNDIRSKGPVQVLRLNVNENPDVANVTTAKQAFTVQIIPSAQVAPRETRGLWVQTSNVENAMQTITNAAGAAGGRVVESSMSQDSGGRSVARIAIEVPLPKTDQLLDTAKQQGKVRTNESTKNAQVPEGPLSRAKLLVTISTEEAIVAPENGLWATVRNGLGTSVRGLLWSLQLIIIGVCLVAPWALLLWGGWRLARRGKRSVVPA